MTGPFLRRPVTTWMVFTVFVVTGLYALPKLKIEAMPEVDLPSISVVTSWNGASPQAIQRSLTLPIEEAVRRVHGVESVRSESRPGRSSVEISFRRDVNLDFAELDINEQLGALRRDLPLGAQPPQVLPYVPEDFRTEQFFAASIQSPLPPNALRQRAEDWVLPRILGIEGVADASIQGGSRPVVKILFDKRKLDLYGLSVDQVMQAIRAMDAVAAAGVIHDDGLEKSISLREPLDMLRLEKAEVARRAGRIFRLGEVATLEAGHEDPLNIVRANGQNVVQLVVDKSSGANTVAVSKALRDALPGIEATLPFEAHFHVESDQGEDLEKKLWELVYRSLVILGLLFLLMAISLRQVKLTAIVTGSIFFAILISLSFFYFLKLSVNFITISGLTVSFGLLLDNSILVLDSVHRRLENLRKDGWSQLTRRAKLAVTTRSILAGTNEVVFPILATTLTTLVAFVSFIFLSGRLSLYYVPLAIAVATALMSSLFVAFGWIPVVLKQAWAGPLVKREQAGDRELEDEDALEAYVEELPDLDEAPRRFEKFVHWTQRLWWILLPGLVALCLWTGLDVYKNRVIKGGFFRMRDREQLFLYLQMPAGTDLRYTAEILRGFEEQLLPVPPGARVQANSFGNQATLSVTFEDSLRATEVPIMFRDRLIEVADRTGGSSIFLSGFSDTPYFKGSFGGSSFNSTIEVSGYNSKTLSEIGEKTLARLERNRRVRKARITSGRRFDRGLQDETVITLNRAELADRGLSVLDVVLQLRLLLRVDTPTQMRIDGKQERVQFSYAGAETIEYADLLGTLVPLPGGGQVRLDQLIAIEEVPTAGTVVRENQRYTINLNWEYVGTDRMRRATIQNTLEGMDLPYGYHAEEAEREFLTDEEEGQLKLMAVLAAVFIFIVLAALFESLSLPLLVLFSLPMAMVGVVLIFWLTHSEFDSSAQIGLVLLFGIVVNNAILLVSRYREEAALTLKALRGGDPGAEAALFDGQRAQLGGSDLRHLPRKEGRHLLRRAVDRGTRIRLRSILLTSLTTIVGLAPLLIHFQDNESKDIWENLALSSIGGLASSTVLLLLMMPALYYFFVRWLAWPVLGLGDRWQRWRDARRRRAAGEPSAASSL
ncbi:MAG: efflux RND transporter permease subunit [Candidatus Krumholzibacteriia bacterium]|nr:efflux RND transporter permease subunit [bacterium]MCB9516352.1 efflux RND transporter permease subunit [Candidatus Latescibacterota bacterium]